MNPVSIIVVEQHDFLRSSLIRWLAGQPILTCCGEAASIADARRVLAETQPKVMLIDMHFEEGEVPSFIRETRLKHPATRIIALAWDEHRCSQALLAGAHACVTKSDATDTLGTRIQAVLGNLSALE
jgi:DNA-binding NarL/FixJ family response regulator